MWIEAHGLRDEGRARARDRRERRVTLEQLGARTAAPPSVLSQVMPVLRTAGVVRSVRGQRGGYLLNHDPAEITLEDVTRLFEGQLAPIDCATRRHPAPCPMTVGCTLRGVWEQVRDDTIATLARSNFADLAAGAGGPWITVAGPGSSKT
jgi:Rrf2 family protein